MRSLHETRERILERAEPIEAIEVPLSEAVGLVLAETHFADVDLPPFDRSEISGYAVRSVDAVPGRALRLLEDPQPIPPTASATAPLSRKAGPGESAEAGHDFETAFSFGFDTDLDFEGSSEEDSLFFSHFDEEDEDRTGRSTDAVTPDEPAVPLDFGLEIGPEEAAWIDAGDPLPIGADAVITAAEILAEPGLGGGPPRMIEPLRKVEAGRNVLPRGDFLRAGTEIGSAGTRLRPSMVGLLAAQGCVHPLCHRRVRVAVMAVGDHLVAPGDPPILQRERNAAGLAVAIPCIQWGTMVHDLGAVPMADLERAIYRATTAPVVLMMAPNSPEVSDVLARSGLETLTSGIALDPCDDLTYGVIRGESGRIESHLFRLSPRPAAALIATILLVGPLVARLQGKSQPDRPRTRRAVWVGRQTETDDRTRAVPVHLEAGADARLLASPISYRGIDDLAGFSQADAIALLPPRSGPWAGGELIDVVPIGQGPGLAGF
jgi:molybdopterin molybdotransferase